MYKFFFICCITAALALPQDYNKHQQNSAASVNSIGSITPLTIPKFLQDALKQNQQKVQANTAVSQPGPQQQQFQAATSNINLGQQLSQQPQQQQQRLLFPLPQQQQQQAIQQQSPSQPQQQFQLHPQQSQQKQSQQQPLLQQITSVQNFLPLQSATSPQQQQQPTILSRQHHSQAPSPLQQQQQQQHFSQLPAQAQLINQHAQSGPVVTKDIYVHIPPFDNEQQQHHLQQQHNLPPPRKHYRIVFIKAPTPNTKSNALHLTQAPIEEKTIIYVLSKKPDSAQLHASIQENLAKYKPSKPEVYFIKYKTPEEAQHAQRTIQAQYDKLGGTTQISDEGVAPVTSVIGSLDVRSSNNNN